MYSNICYKKNYLKSVIVRVDFANPIEGIDKELNPSVIKKVMSYFPIAEPKKGLTKEMHFSLEKVSQKNSEFVEWNFYGKEREKKLIFIPSAFIVDYNLYSSYKEMRLELIGILDSFFQVYSDSVCSRIGLRYINDIDLSEQQPLNWTKYINSKMLGILDLYPDKQYLSRAFQNLEFNFGEFHLKFQFGMSNPDFPAPIRRKSYILDFDAYYQGLQDNFEIPSNLDKFHNRIQELFEMSITKEFREYLNE